MRAQQLALALLLSAACMMAACQQQESARLVGGARALSPPSGTPSAQERVNLLFAVTQEQLRKSFDDFESKGENNQQVSVGEKQTLTVVARGSNDTESLKLTVMFLPPIEQAGDKGYQFGLVAKSRTPDDRKDFENTSLTTIMNNRNQVTFRVWLDQPKDPNAAIPPISYQLLDKDSQRVNPTTQPASYIFSGKDLIGDVALAEDGQELIFPLYRGVTPNLTDKMDKMTLVVKIDDTERNLEFRLKL